MHPKANFARNFFKIDNAKVQYIDALRLPHKLSRGRNQNLYTNPKPIE